MPTLRPIEFEILLSLAQGDRHGYAIIQDIQVRGGDVVETGTLYRALQRLTEQDFVRPVARRGTDEDERRQYYAVTASGRAAAAVEARRLEGLVTAARLVRLLPGGAR